MTLSYKETIKITGIVTEFEDFQKLKTWIALNPELHTDFNYSGDGKNFWTFSAVFDDKTDYQIFTRAFPVRTAIMGVVM